MKLRRTDPVCHLSPDHEIVAEVVRGVNQGFIPLRADLLSGIGLSVMAVALALGY